MNLRLIKLVVKTLVLGLLSAMAAGILYWLFFASNWSWFPTYLPLMIKGLSLTLQLFVISVVFGFILAVPIGLVQVTGPPWLAFLARWFCTVIRGTPLLIQIWLLYYGLGSLFPSIPGIRDTFIWPVLREGYYYAALAFTLSFAGYEGEVMRGAFLGVPRGELEAARAFGMSPWKVLTRVWLPRAMRLVLPTLAGETVLQLQSMPLAFTVTVMELVGVASKVRQDTYIVYEPLMFMGFVYICLTFIFVYAFGLIEKMVPQKR
jgi:polar amino acid transport system permease protein